jgi:hypothetical protein
MASTKSVPTKVAQHAIRGLLFTTSCSVVLLAEERRRRIKITKTALENARKIHTAKSHRSAVALGSETIGSWEYRLNDDQEIARIPSRQRNSLEHVESRKLKGRATELDLPKSARIEIEPMLRAASEAVLQEAVGLTSLSLLSSPLHATNHTKRNARNTQISKNTNLTPLADKGIEADVVQNGTDLRAKLKALAAELRPESEASVRPGGPEFDSIKNARLYLLAESETNGISSPPTFEDGLAILSQLVAGLYSNDGQQSILEDRFDLALRILQQIAIHGITRITADVQLRPMCLALLQHAVLTNPDKLATIFDSTAKLFMQMKILYPFMAWLQAEGHNEAIESLLSFISGPNSPQGWSCGRFMAQYFGRRFSHGIEYSEMRNLYNMIRDAEYFRKFSISGHHECRIRKFIILRAEEAGDHTFAAAEIESLCTAYPVYLDSSFSLQTAIVLQLARDGRWDSVSAKLKGLVSAHGTSSRGLRKMVSRVTDVVAKERTAEELKTWVEDIVVSSGLALNSRCPDKVLREDREKTDAVIFTWLSKLAEEEQWDKLCQVYTDMSNKGQIKSDRCLRLGVVGHLRADEGRTERAAALVSAAEAQGKNVTHAATPLQLAQIEEGADAEEIIYSSLRRRIRLHDSVYNKASQRLSALGKWQAATEVCQIAARENGGGDLLYSVYNFSNLIYVYTGSMCYDALGSILDSFCADSAPWHGSSICKESIKFAMKRVAMRAIAAEALSKGVKHHETLGRLDAALQHVSICRHEFTRSRASKKATVRMNTSSHQMQSSSYAQLGDNSKKTAPEADRWAWSSDQRVLQAEPA